MCLIDALLPAAILEVTAVDLEEVRMRAVETGLYVAMDGAGRLYGEV